MAVDDDPTPQSVAALVAYDGTDYCGFQVQPGVPTIQGTLEAALGTFTSLVGRVVGAGRTDSGVHARGQVVTAHVHWRHDCDALQRAWNAHLPPSIVVRAVQTVPVLFHPRFSATARTYRYFVVEHDSQFWSAPRTSPLTDRFALYVSKALDSTAMQEAAALLVGTHDFATFGVPPQGEQTVRTVYEATWQLVKSDLPTLEPQSDHLWAFTIRANAFLRHMVRNLTGALLAVGRGEWRVEDVQSALHAKDRHESLPPAPAAGLMLERIEYPAELGIRF